MKTLKGLIILLFCPFIIWGKCNQIDCSLMAAIKTKKIKLLVPYVLKNENGTIDSLYLINLDQSLSNIEENLNYNGIKISKCQLISSQRTFGIHGILKLTLSDGNSTIFISIQVKDINGKDFLTSSSLPFVDSKKRHQNRKPKFDIQRPTIAINHVKYEVWELRESDKELAKKIISKDINNGLLLLKPLDTLQSGIINSNNEFIVYLKTINEATKETFLTFISLNKEIVISTEKEINIYENKTLTELDETKLLKLLELKYDSLFAKEFLDLRKKRILFEDFLDSLIDSIIVYSGNYAYSESGSVYPTSLISPSIIEDFFEKKENGFFLLLKIIVLRNDFLNIITNIEKKQIIKDKIYRFEDLENNTTTWKDYLFNGSISGNLKTEINFPMIRLSFELLKKMAKDLEFYALKYLIEVN